MKRPIPLSRFHVPAAHPRMLMHSRNGFNLACLLAASSLCSCVSDDDTRMTVGEIDASGQAAAESEDGGQPPVVESSGTLSCQSAAPTQLLTAPTCGDEALACDVALEERLRQLLERCSFTLNENALEFFFDQGCAIGLTLSRADPELTDEARRCVSNGFARMRVGCPKSLCVHVEHSTLAAL